jgi:hypothetical protein
VPETRRQVEADPDQSREQPQGSTFLQGEADAQHHLEMRNLPVFDMASASPSLQTIEDCPASRLRGSPPF